VFSFPARRWIAARFQVPGRNAGLELSAVGEIASMIALLTLLFLSLMVIAAGTYNPFLYFRF
jgi:hypothetical protein